MDRGYHDYSKLIQKLACKFDIEGRLHYIHDQHLPTLLSNAIGTVVVNCTVGFSSLYHDTPVKVCGRAIYDLEGLTYKGSLDEFWHGAANFKIDRELFTHFRNYLILTTQLNGSFYKRLKTPHGSYHITIKKKLPKNANIHPYAFIEHKDDPSQPS